MTDFLNAANDFQDEMQKTMESVLGTLWSPEVIVGTVYGLGEERLQVWVRLPETESTVTASAPLPSPVPLTTSRQERVLYEMVDGLARELYTKALATMVPA